MGPGVAGGAVTQLDCPELLWVTVGALLFCTAGQLSLCLTTLVLGEHPGMCNGQEMSRERPQATWVLPALLEAPRQAGRGPGRRWLGLTPPRFLQLSG